MTELQAYVEKLFRHRRMTPELRELKEEILSNMAAKRDDLIAQGFDRATATQKAKESLPSIDSLIDGNQLTDVHGYRVDCLQAVFRNCILFWIFSLPLLFLQRVYRALGYLGLWLTVLSGILYFWQCKKPPEPAAFLSIAAGQRRKKLVWLIWGIFFAVCAGTMAALTFGSNIWFGRPFPISGPYALATFAARFYAPLLTIFVPITIGSFPKLLAQNRKEHEHD